MKENRPRSRLDDLEVAVLNRILLAAALLLSPAPEVPADSGGTALTVRGVGLGAFLPEVLARLGRPERIIDQPKDEFLGMGELKDLDYSGLLVETNRPDGSPDFEVWRITVTSKRWRVAPGLRVGMSERDLRTTLGPPGASRFDEATGTTILTYKLKAGVDGWTWVRVEGGKVKEIGTTQDWT